MQALEALLDLALPRVCAGCGVGIAADPVLCASCDAGLERLREALEPPPPLAACVAGAEFRGAVAAWIHRFKYPAPGLAGIEAASGAAVRALVLEAGQRAPRPWPDAVVPVPLHPRRRRRRGFNPAGLLAGCLSRRLGLHLDATCLLRVRDTPSQTGLSRGQRRRNVRGAFACHGRVARRVWLVDDVLTTGSTLAAAARALRAGGAREIVGVVVAATPRGTTR